MMPPVLFWAEPSVRGIAFMAWARSSAVEHTLHTGGVTGSIPVAPTTPFSQSLGRTQFRGLFKVRAMLDRRTQLVPLFVDRRNHRPHGDSQIHQNRF